ncbi:MAG: phosphoribosylglycinamide formyltransferase [Fulvivirga sp.]|nr:phosphoribosylglycinamide formyltransferase [Fulvivirga sp.]
MVNIAIFASGNGSNAEEIIKYFKDDNDVKVALILSNKSDAYVLHRAKKYGIDTIVFNRQQLKEGEVLEDLKKYKIDFIILAGFLWLIPTHLVVAYPNRIINIHPALLPRHGGKGMYGEKVHQAVLASGDRETGITIHYVNEHYDKGNVIFQARCDISPEDTADSIASKVHVLEYEHFPKIIDKVIKSEDRATEDL